MTIEIGTQDDGEDCDAVVCIPVTTPLSFPDNEIGECFRCGCAVQFRPHAPKRPPRMCFDCYAMDVKDEHNIMITPATAAEVMARIRKKSAN